MYCSFWPASARSSDRIFRRQLAMAYQPTEDVNNSVLCAMRSFVHDHGDEDRKIEPKGKAYECER